MSTAIEWTDETWNPVTGCDKVSAGCKNCYAEGVAERFWATQYPPVTETATERDSAGYPVKVQTSRPRRFTDVMTHEDRLDQPLRWRQPRRVFVNSMSDLFHDDVSDAFIDRVFAVMALAPRHTFQVLTKRAERMRAYMTAPDVRERVSKVAAAMCGDPSPEMAVRFWPLLNVWLGVSVENQRFADERIPLLLQTPAAIRFISAEPLLERVDLGLEWLAPFQETDASMRRTPRLDWVIVGGESGAGARPFRVAWARGIVQQCRAAAVPVFVKQLGADARANYYDELAESAIESRGGEWPDPIDWDIDHEGQPPLDSDVRLPLKDRKGGDLLEWPEDLRVREFLEVASAVLSH